MKHIGLKFSQPTTLSNAHALLDIYAQAGLNGFKLPPELALKYVKTKKKAAKTDKETEASIAPKTANGHMILGINDAYVLLVTYVASERKASGTNPFQHTRTIASDYTFLRFVNQKLIKSTVKSGDIERAARLQSASRELILQPIRSLLERDSLESFYQWSSNLSISFTQIDKTGEGYIVLGLLSTDTVDRVRHHKALARKAVTIYELHLAKYGLTLADVKQEMCSPNSPRRVD